MMSIFGPRACSTISAATSTLDRSTLDRSSALDLTSAPSTSRTGVRATDEPGSPSIFSILTRSPSATLYCFPPVLTIAYIEGYPLSKLGSRTCLDFCRSHILEWTITSNSAQAAHYPYGTADSSPKQQLSKSTPREA